MTPGKRIEAAHEAERTAEPSPPPDSSSGSNRERERLVPVPEPYLNKSLRSAPGHDAIHRIVDGVDEAGRALRIR